MNKLFDLNIEQVLEHWEAEHAVREIIANAIDEQLLTNSEPIRIFKTNNEWHIRDYGRGLQYFHFTQNENDEKLKSPFLIGKFGVGLKDALAVFYRKGIEVEVNSRYARISLVMSNKPGFSVKTLHAAFNESKDINMIGTDFIIKGISDEAINKARSMFLCFNENISLLEKTKYGEVYSCSNSVSVIYINGVQVAIEENFMFSYNITNINSKIKKALNRERSNVGRTAYSETIKNILRQCTSNKVLLTLVDDLKNVISGNNKDESGWVDVAVYAAQSLNQNNNVVFMTPMQRANLTNQEIEILNQSDKRLVMITDSVYSKINDCVNTFNTVYKEYNDKFRYEFITYDMLTEDEMKVFSLKENVIDFLINHQYKHDAEIRISETIKVDAQGHETQGICNFEENMIIIKRSALASKPKFLGVLTHEFSHYQHGYLDNSRDFENELTKMLGFALSDNIKCSKDKSTSSKSVTKSSSKISNIFHLLVKRLKGEL